jgi:ABC-type hemin transport system ATPase subunit
VLPAAVWVVAARPAHIDGRPLWESLELLRAVAGARGVGVVASAHPLNPGARAADELVLLAAGRVLARGPAARVLTPEHLERAYGLAVEVVADPAGGPPLVVPARQAAPMAGGGPRSIHPGGPADA